MSNSVIKCDSANKLGLSFIKRNEQEDWEACHSSKEYYIHPDFNYGLRPVPYHEDVDLKKAPVRRYKLMCKCNYLVEPAGRKNVARRQHDTKSNKIDWKRV